MLVSKEELMALTDEEQIGIVSNVEKKILDERLNDYHNKPLDIISWGMFYKREIDRINDGSNKQS